VEYGFFLRAGHSFAIFWRKPLSLRSFCQTDYRGDMRMSLLPAIPVVLLVIVAVWFFWPVVVDPIVRSATRRGLGEADQLAENLFDQWNEGAQGRG